MNKKGVFYFWILLGITIVALIYAFIVLTEQKNLAAGIIPTTQSAVDKLYGNTNPLGSSAIQFLNAQQHNEEETIFISHAAQLASEEAVLSNQILIGGCGIASNGYGYMAREGKIESCRPSLTTMLSTSINKRLLEYLAGERVIAGTQAINYKYDISILESDSGTSIIGVNTASFTRTFFNNKFELLPRFHATIPAPLFLYKRGAEEFTKEVITCQDTACITDVLTAFSNGKYIIQEQPCIGGTFATDPDTHTFCLSSKEQFTRLELNTYVTKPIQYGFVVEIPKRIPVQITKFSINGVPSNGDPDQKATLSPLLDEKLNFIGELLTPNTQGLSVQVCTVEAISSTKKCEETIPVFDTRTHAHFSGELISPITDFMVVASVKNSESIDETAGIQVMKSVG